MTAITIRPCPPAEYAAGLLAAQERARQERRAEAGMRAVDALGIAVVAVIVTVAVAVAAWGGQVLR